MGGRKHMRIITTADIIKWIREDTLYKFYTSKFWRKLRADAIKRDNNECQRCKELGKVTVKVEGLEGNDVTLTVHHIEEVRKNPYRALDINNLITLCEPCHNEVHDKYKNLNKVKSKGQILSERFPEFD